jgi:hypothetical protein
MDPAEQFMQSLLMSGPNDSVNLQAHLGAFSAGGTSNDASQAADKSDDDNDDDMDNAPGIIVDPGLVSAGSSVQVRPIVETCRQLKLHKNFSPESEADLDVFAVSTPVCSNSIPLTWRTLQNARSIEEHLAIVLAVTLENCDLLNTLRPTSSWVVLDALSVSILFIYLFFQVCYKLITQENIRTYATAFLLCPTLSSYRGKVANKLLVCATSTSYGISQ